MKSRRWANILWAVVLTCCTAGQITYARDGIGPPDATLESVAPDAPEAPVAPDSSVAPYAVSPASPTCGSSPTCGGSSSCGSCCCNTPCYTNCCPCPWSGIYAAAEATFLDPNFGNTSSKVTLSDPISNPVTVSNGSTGSQSLGFAPRVWIGYVCPSGWGIRGRFWELNTSSTSTQAPVTLTQFGGTSSSLFNAYTTDIEVTRQLFYSPVGIALASFGVRNGGIRHAESQSVSGFGPTTGNFLMGSAATSSQFYGTGLTGGLQLLRPFYQGSYGNLGIFGGYQGSILWGNSAQAASAQALVGTGAATFIDNQPQPPNPSSITNPNTMYINELQLGLQWSKVLPRWRNNRAFARLVFEYQNWCVGNNRGGLRYVAGEPPPGTVGSGEVVSEATARALQSVNLVGFGIAAGCYW